MASVFVLNCFTVTKRILRLMFLKRDLCLDIKTTNENKKGVKEKVCIKEV